MDLGIRLVLYCQLVLVHQVVHVHLLAPCYLGNQRVLACLVLQVALPLQLDLFLRGIQLGQSVQWLQLAQKVLSVLFRQVDLSDPKVQLPRFRQDHRAALVGLSDP